jgi:hypothetical protein
MALSSLIESDKDDDDDDASSTALGLMADGSGSQPYFQFSDEDMRNSGGCLRQLPRHETGHGFGRG